MANSKQNQITRLRKSQRAIVEHRVYLDAQPMIMLDLSLTGFRLKGLNRSMNFTADESLIVSWMVLPTMEPIHLEGRCIWRHEDKAGFVLKNLNEKTKFLIRSLVRQHRSLES